MISAGNRLDLSKPLDQEGNFTRGSIGCHRGHMEALNVKNARPGHHYYYFRTDSSSLDRAELQGWDFVKLTDPEKMGQETRSDRVAAGLDSTQTRNDIVLCRMPDERYSVHRAQIDQRSDGMRGDSAAEFMEKGRPLQDAYGEQVYFKSAGHGFRHS